MNERKKLQTRKQTNEGRREITRKKDARRELRRKAEIFKERRNSTMKKQTR